MFDAIETINRVYGMRAALREADMRGLDVRYNQQSFLLDCYYKGVLVNSFLRRQYK